MEELRKGELSQSEAEEIANAFTSACPVTLRPMDPYLPSALNIALRWKCTVYDALCLSLALAEDCRLITADDQFARVVQGTELESVAMLCDASCPLAFQAVHHHAPLDRDASDAGAADSPSVL